ncbi:hypothetical protein [Bacillus cereus]|uniref:hypothetical protein n=1 Tax=Bacillus cereus TaxID=1396 RepID=UPI000BF73FA6|nr:hypothetical protein [Bacillus cereus]PFI26552.1 hypothetical protein COI75_01035 [Bacillus cereus]
MEGVGFIFVLFVASIVSGKLYWNKKVANATGQTSEVTKTAAEAKDSGAKKEEKKQEAKSSFNEAYAKNYPKAIEGLKQFATQNGYTYVDHWGAWPDATTKAILPYLQEEFGFPSAKGHEVWAQYVTDYFVAK